MRNFGDFSSSAPVAGFIFDTNSVIVKIRPVRPTPIETFQEFPEMGRFALRDMGATIAAGVVKEITEAHKV